MSKIIIENRSSLGDIDAINKVKTVINMGRISNNEKQYCYYTVFANGSDNGNHFCGVSATANKCSDKFIVVDEKY